MIVPIDLSIRESLQAARAKANASNKTVLFDALAVAGITSVHADFDGAGDSGQINDVTAHAGEQTADFPCVMIVLHDTEWGKQDLTTRERGLREAVEDLCYGCLEQTHPGWENNDGARGEFAFDVAARSITLSFTGYYTESWHDEHVF